MKRNIWLDTIRGLLLIFMANNHFNGILTPLTNLNGYISAAEGFVLVSGITYGLVYSYYFAVKKIDIKSKSFKRGFQIYKYHIIAFVVVVLLTLAAYYSNVEYLVSNTDRLSEWLKFPISASAFYSIFLYQPSYFDILPMYIIFILIAPFALMLIYRGKTWLVLSISLVLWLTTQFSAVNDFIWQIERIPGVRLGALNPFSWQILFFFGIYLGHLLADGKILIKYTKSRIFFAGFLIVIFYAYRLYSSLSLNDIHIYLMYGKKNLVFVRLINMAIMIYFIGGIATMFPLKVNNVFSILGRHSLQVFAFHIVLAYILHFFNVLVYDNLMVNIFFNILFVCLLYIPAIYHEKQKNNNFSYKEFFSFRLIK